MNIRFMHTRDTDKTKLKLDKEVGGGVLFELCTITYLITYPYARTVNFEICIDVQLTTHQPLIAKASQAAAWSYRYNGNWVGKTEGSPSGFIQLFWRLKSRKNPLAKVVDFERLGALFGPGTPDPDFACSYYALLFGTYLQNIVFVILTCKFWIFH